MNVLLVQPPINKESVVLGVMEPLALEVLAASIKQDADLAANAEIMIVDLRLEKPDSLLNILRTYRPQIVGVTGITMDYPTMIQVLTEVKAYAGDIVTVVGGHHATMVPQDFYLPCVDGIVRGAGYPVFPDILKKLYDKKALCSLPGVLWRQDGEYQSNNGVHCNITISNQPIADRSLTARYRRRYRLDDAFNWALVVTSGGCPSRCSFCACWKITGGKYLTRSAEDVVEEISRVPEKRILLCDDNTFADIKRAYKICQLIKERGIRKILQAYCRADIIAEHPDLIQKWRDVGLDGLTVGFESPNDDTLDRLNKKSSVHINEKANEILYKTGIRNFAHFLIDPSFERDDFTRIWKYVERLGVIDPVFPVLTPLPNTDFRQSCGSIHPDEHQYYDLVHPLTPTRLDTRDFYDELLGLMYKNYSFGRWLRASYKRLINSLSRSEVYPWQELRAPKWYAIPVAKMWIRRQLNNSNMDVFIDKIENRRQSQERLG